MSETAACDSPGRKIGFVGDSGVGKTMVATVVAARIREEAAFAVHGEASEIVSPETRTVESGVIDSWVVYDASAGPKGFTEIADEMDVAFVVATPERLDSVRAYEAIASATDTDLFSVINRFSEDDRERLRAFEGPSLAEYFFEREAIRETLVGGNVPQMEEWSVDAILIAALQPEPYEFEDGLAALKCGDQQIVNVEVADSDAAKGALDGFVARGYRAAYYECNCRCHEGHVLAITPRYRTLAAETKRNAAFPITD